MKMKRSLLIGIILCLVGITSSYAQWTRQDSVRVRDLLNGHNSILLNLETQPSFIGDTALSNGRIRYRMRLLPTPLLPEIIKEIPLLSLPDTITQINLQRLPPSVLALYAMEASWQEVYEFKSCKLYEVYYPEPAVRSGGVGVVVTFSAEDLLRYIFWKSARAKKHNAKHATAWKYYNTIP